MDIVIHSYRSNTASDLEDLLSAINLRHLATELKRYGFQNREELQLAVLRASQIIETNGLNLRAHIRPIYTCLDGMTQQDWRLSEMAMRLVILNGNPSSLAVAQIQWELVKSL